MSKHPARPRRNQRGPHIYKRGPVWYAYLPERPDGISLRTRDEAQARVAFRVLVATGAPPADGARPVEHTLAECAREWLDAPHGYTSRTRQSHRERIRAWVIWCEETARITLPHEVTPAVVDRWITERSAAVARRTINRDLRSVKVCLRWCAARGLCQPVEAIAERAILREPKRRSRRVVPSPTEMTAILGHVSATLRPVLAVLCGTGLRIEELRRLAVGDLHDGRIFVRPEAGAADVAEPSKGYRERSVPIAEAVQEQVQKVLGWKGTRRGRACHKHQLRRALHAACDAAKVPRCGLHDLRRAFATECVRAGIPLTVVSGWLGHRLTSTTEAYVSTYRSDGAHVAPVPAALTPGSAADSAPTGAETTAEKLPKTGVVLGHFGATRATRKAAPPKGGK